MQKKKKMEAIWSQTVFGVSKEGAEAWHRVSITNIVSKYGSVSLAFSLLTPADRYLAPLNVDEVLKLYCVEVVRQMQPVFDSSGPVLTTGLNAFLNPLFFHITSRTFFGPEFPAETIYPPFMAFDGGFSRLAAAMPRIFVPQAYAGRTEVARQLKDYIAAPHTPCGAVERIEDGALEAGLGPDDVAGYLLSALWPLTANVGNATFWTLYLLMKDGSGGLVNLQTEIDSAVAGWKAAHAGSDPFKDAATLFAFFKASKFPYFDSLFKEVLRFTSSSNSVRRVEQDGAVLIGGEGQVFTFKEDDTIMCTHRFTHFDEEVYADAHKFIPERFMADARHTKNGKDLPNFWMAFGGGTSIVRNPLLYRGSVRADIESITIEVFRAASCGGGDSTRYNLVIKSLPTPIGLIGGATTCPPRSFHGRLRYRSTQGGRACFAHQKARKGVIHQIKPYIGPRGRYIQRLHD